MHLNPVNCSAHRATVSSYQKGLIEGWWERETKRKRGHEQKSN